MYKVAVNKTKRDKRKKMIRGHLSGTAEMPRMTVFRSNKYIYAQIIDDVSGVTLVAATSQDQKDKVAVSKNVGMDLAKKAIAKGVKQVAFDRNGYKYHGRVKSLVDGAREGGLKI